MRKNNPYTAHIKISNKQNENHIKIYIKELTQ